MVLPLLNDLVGLKIGVGVVGLPEDFLVAANKYIGFTFRIYLTAAQFYHV